jgi:ubiquitin-protein ligase
MAPHTVARKLQDEQIVVDTVLIGNGGGDDDFNPVRAITAACGGVTFKPETISEALQLFEQETVLSLRERSGVAPQEAVRSRVDLQQRQLALPVFATRPPRHQPVQLELAAARAQELLRRYRSATPSSASSSAASSSSRTNPLRIKRLLREMARYERDPHPFIEAFPCEDDMSFWQFILIGPNQTPYEGGCFTLWASFPDSYPAHAMEMRFTTPIYHCNINSTGKVCHSVFDRNWTSDMSVRQVLDCVYGLLLHPEPDDPLDSVLAAKFYENRAEYDSCAVMATNKYARQETPEQCRARLLKEGDDETAAAAGSTKGAVASGIPEFLVCPLTLELFKDPVVTPHGHTFERTAIEAAIVAQGKCPLSRQPLTSEQLVANYAIKGAVAEHKKVMAQTPWWEND